MAYVIGLFDARAQADAAVSDLKTAGIGDVDYSLSDREHTLTGWLARLFGMQHDAGTLQSHGVPVQDAQWYDDQLNRGYVLLVARVNGDAEHVAETVREEGATDVRVYAEHQGAWERVRDEDLVSGRWRDVYGDEAEASAADRPRTGDVEERRIPVREEELRIGKREREAGEVTITKDIREEPVHQDVSLTRERVRVERRPVREMISGNVEPIREGDTIRIPLVEEEAVVEKRPVVREEIVITKERETYTQPVQETVKKEDVRVEGDKNQVRSKGMKDLPPDTNPKSQKR